MNGDYVKYLLLMLLIITVASAISIMLLFRARKQRLQKTKTGSSIMPVNGGNISIFFDKQGNATIIPYVADLFGSGKATSDIIILNLPYKPGNLGAVIKNAMISCRKGKPINSAELMEMLQARGWKEFSEGKRNLSVYYKDNKGIVFNTTVRTAEGAYVFNTRGAEFILPANADNEIIGSTSIELLKRCR